MVTHCVDSTAPVQAQEPAKTVWRSRDVYQANQRDGSPHVPASPWQQGTRQPTAIRNSSSTLGSQNRISDPRDRRVPNQESQRAVGNWIDQPSGTGTLQHGTSGSTGSNEFFLSPGDQSRLLPPQSHRVELQNQQAVIQPSSGRHFDRDTGRTISQPNARLADNHQQSQWMTNGPRVSGVSASLEPATGVTQPNPAYRSTQPLESSLLREQSNRPSGVGNEVNSLEINQPSIGDWQRLPPQGREVAQNASNTTLPQNVVVENGYRPLPVVGASASSSDDEVGLVWLQPRDPVTSLGGENTKEMEPSQRSETLSVDQSPYSKNASSENGSGRTRAIEPTGPSQLAGLGNASGKQNAQPIYLIAQNERSGEARYEAEEQKRLADEREQQQALARQISYQNLAAAPSRGGIQPNSLESPVGWSSLEAELRSKLQECDRLLRTGAILSGRREAMTALRSLTRSIDSRRGGWYSEPALNQALIALQESEDFYDSTQLQSSQTDMAGVIAGHQTPALNGYSLDAIAPMVAAQHYRSYARDRLVECADAHPWAADILYAIGKSYEGAVTHQVLPERQAFEIASVYYAASLTVNPAQADAANQLGYALLKLDRKPEANQALQHAMQIRPNRQVVLNLAELYRREGNQQGIQWSTQQLANYPEATESTVPEIVQLDATQFAQISPHVNYGNQNPATERQLVEQSEVQTASASADSSAPELKSGEVRQAWWKRLFR